MPTTKTGKPAVITYADYEVITPSNPLRKAVMAASPSTPEDDPVGRAEKALAQLSPQFARWMDSECERLDLARHKVKAKGFLTQTREELFHAAHDIKGEAATFGFPAVAAAADSLCRLIEHTPDATRIPMSLVDQHVDAVRAIFREYARSDAKQVAALLTTRLREVTEEFLTSESKGGTTYIDRLLAPPLTPSEPG